ncbi:unnamed protein product [marine sediment metagenome]|uniref:Uncharacterized protein n=1 Tax=marine sediment metagenome TaxID=412755 RepID=X1TZJ3_9ZZZZ
MKGFRIKGISYDDKYIKEQKEIVKRVKKEVDGKEGQEWFKYKGDITAQIVISHLKNHLPKHLKIVGHNFFRDFFDIFFHLFFVGLYIL